MIAKNVCINDKRIKILIKATCYIIEQLKDRFFFKQVLFYIP